MSELEAQQQLNEALLTQLREQAQELEKSKSRMEIFVRGAAELEKELGDAEEKIEALEEENAQLRAGGAGGGDSGAEDTSALRARIVELEGENSRLRSHLRDAEEFKAELERVRAELNEEKRKSRRSEHVSAASSGPSAEVQAAAQKAGFRTRVDVRKDMMSINRGMSLSVMESPEPSHHVVAEVTSSSSTLPEPVHGTQLGAVEEVDLTKALVVYYEPALHQEWVALVKSSGVTTGFVGQMLMDQPNKVLEKGGDIIFLRDTASQRLIASIVCQKVKAGFDGKLLCCAAGVANKDDVIASITLAGHQFAKGKGEPLQLMPLDTGYDRGFFFDLGAEKGRAGRIQFTA